MRVEWDDAKSRSNRQKHGLSFEEAAKLWTGSADFLEMFDDAHSEHEDRFLAIGPIEAGLILVVWTERDEDVIRIVSARWATAREQGLYHSYRELQS